MLNGAFPWDADYIAVWLDFLPSLLITVQQIFAEFGLTHLYFLDQRQYLLLYMFVQTRNAVNFADAFISPVINLAVTSSDDTTTESEETTTEATVTNHIPTDFSAEGFAYLATLAWWLRLASLGIREYAEPFLSFDVETLAAVAAFNSVVGIIDVDLQTALTNTALTTPSMILLYTLFAADLATTDSLLDEELLDMFAA